MKLGIQLIMCWTTAVAIGGVFAGSMIMAHDSGYNYEQVSLAAR